MISNGVFILIVSSLLLFVFTIKLIEYIPKKYHGNIHLMRSLGTFLIISGAFVTYYRERNEKVEKQKKEYSDIILTSFNELDMFLIGNYKELSPIIQIFYNRIELPSTNTNLNKIVKNLNNELKDTLFILYNKLTTIFEKMYLINPTLFDNSELGLKVKMYIDNILYYEFWTSTKRIYNTKFIIFMENKYKFLTILDFRYTKPDRNIYRIPYMKDASFIFLSSKNNEKWY
jgi:hypothetical protein